jgi:hypothetical protein
MDFAGASLNLKANGANELLAMLDKIDKRGQEVANRLSKSLGNALGGAGGGADLRNEAEKTEKSLLNMSHHSAMGLEELAHAFARMAESGKLGAFSIREFSSAAASLLPGRSVQGVGGSDQKDERDDGRIDVDARATHGRIERQ